MRGHRERIAEVARRRKRAQKIEERAREDLRRLISAARDDGLTAQECADAMGVSRQALYAYKWLRGPQNEDEDATQTETHNTGGR
jgi:DNA invertase Pin-like site-specific DNA recombinase